MEKFLNELVLRFSGITLRDVCDILILSLLFFSVYRFVRKRRAFAALIGTAVFVAVRFAISAVRLDATASFLDFFYNAGAIVLILIFQSDIRAFLEKIGGFIIDLKGHIITIFCPKYESKEAEAIVKAVTRLSSSRTGALIVLERSAGVDEISEKGVLIDSLITSELICNIFFSPAPLHDGAIIIRGKRIHSAACMLPNYTDPEISPSFGSRHRAAIGMSRMSDAGVIVVSEEDGRVSYANSGELLRGIEFGKLREVLDEYYGVRPSKKSKKKK